MLNVIFGESNTGKTMKAKSISREKQAKYIIANSSLRANKLIKILEETTQKHIVIDNAESLNAKALMAIKYFCDVSYISITLIGHTRLKQTIENIPPLLRRVRSMKEMVRSV